MNAKNFLIILGLIFCVIEVTNGKIKTSLRIIDGKPARPKQFPYMVGLKIEALRNGPVYWCGGSLIDKRWVLTAAHCLFNQKFKYDENGTAVEDGNNKAFRHSLIAYIGGVNNRNTSEFQLIYVPGNPNFLVNPEFLNTENDIGLIHLPEEARINDFVQVISLPPPGIGKLENEVITVTGWGATNPNFFKSARFLQYVNMKVLENEECEKTYPVDANVERMFCVDTSNGKNTCHGDSGGPGVITMKNNQKVVVGIISTGNCRKNLPTGFTRVSFYLDWIKNTMKNF